MRVDSPRGEKGAPVRLPRFQRTIWLLPAVLSVVVCAAARSGFAQEPPAAGLHDLVIYAPGTHERDLPAIRFQPNPETGKQTVEIPPTVHVHRYYYSGDKEIQGPIIQGGPTMVVARHPKTSEQLYIDVMLPAGTPRIAYTKHSITYVYPDRRVAIHFSSRPGRCDRVIVKHHSGQGVARTASEVAQQAKEHTAQRLSESQLVRVLGDTASGAGRVVAGVGGTTGAFATWVADLGGQVLNLVPGMAPLEGLGEEAPQTRYLESIDRAAQRAARAAPDFLPTNR